MIAVIDYGAGNIFSVENALRYLGQEHILTDDPDTIRQADAIILPGVGAFPSAYQAMCPDSVIAASCEYGSTIPALVYDGAYVFGAQFHPEKSGEIGLQMLRNFAALA